MLYNEEEFFYKIYMNCNMDTIWIAKKTLNQKQNKDPASCKLLE